MEIDIYQLAYEKRMSSKNDIRELAQEILTQEGFDPTIVHLKDEGISIDSFKKLVKALYIAGYKDGLEQNANLQHKHKLSMLEGKAQKRHARMAIDIQKKEIYKIV